jgi:hypothetical protein
MEHGKNVNDCVPDTAYKKFKFRFLFYNDHFTSPFGGSFEPFIDYLDYNTI